MALNYLSHVAGPAAAQAQEVYYGRAFFPTAAPEGTDRLGPDEVGFIGRRDSFYIASLSESGWPYVQHRGGPPGFLHVLDSARLAFADVRGNRQLLSTANVAIDPRVSLFLIDYARRERLKILARAHTLDAREYPDLAARITPSEWRGKAERLMIFDVVSHDWNCPKYITPRYTAEEVEEVVQPLRERIAELETALSRRST